MIYNHDLDSNTKCPSCRWPCSRCELQTRRGQISGLPQQWAAFLLEAEGTEGTFFQPLSEPWGATASFLIPGWVSTVSSLVQPYLPSLCSAWATKQGPHPGGQSDGFRNMGSEGRLVCQPPKHFPDKEEISKNRWMRTVMADGSWSLKRRGKGVGYG